MRDAASQVLAERQALQRGFGGAVVASVALHLLVGVAFAVAPRSKPSSGIQRPVVVKLSPVGSFDDRVERPKRTSPTPAPRQDTAAVIETPAATLPPKPPPPTKQDLPRSREADRETVRTSVFGASPRVIDAPEGETSARPAAMPPAGSRSPAGLSAGAAPEVGSAGVTGLEGGDFPYTIYIERMLTLIGKRWFRPDLAGTPTTQVYFVIERDGSVRGARVETSSGSGVFDRAALRAVVETSPLPPLPFAYRGTYLGVHLTFH